MKLTPAQYELLREAGADLKPLPDGRPLHDRTLVSLEKHGLVQIFRNGRESFWCLTDQGKAYRNAS